MTHATITHDPLHSNGKRQKAYRERKKKAKFYATSYPYRRLFNLCAKFDYGNDILSVINEVYDVCGEKMTVKICCHVNEILSTAQSLAGGPGRLPQANR